jgi:hypothetical protein
MKICLLGSSSQLIHALTVTDSTLTFSCTCETVRITTSGAPIMAVACYCNSCQTAGRQLLDDTGASVVNADGGTDFVLVRKDRVNWSIDPASLVEHRLSAESPTRRVCAACCGAPLFLEFQNGHWLSLYAQRLPASQRPAIQLRTMTRDAPNGVTFTDGVPSPKTHSLGFMARLLWAWVAMGLRSPKVEVGGSISK